MWRAGGNGGVDTPAKPGYPLFAGGGLRMTGRTLPSGEPVWEIALPDCLLHAPFARATPAQRERQKLK